MKLKIRIKKILIAIKLVTKNYKARIFSFVRPSIIDNSG